MAGLTKVSAQNQQTEELHIFTDAKILANQIRTREISVLELLQQYLDQIERIDPHVNAIPTLRPRAELLEEARGADRILSRGDNVGALFGLPMAIKDLSLTKGLLTTRGSRIYQNFVPDTDELYVERLRQAGAIIIGKTNTPEFGAGSQTYNEVFGATRNPYDLSKTCGGSSGGAAVALACGMVPLADGTDLGGSLRNPASFCNIVGFRPSIGRVPKLSANAWNSLSVHGPMARTVSDLAFLLSVMAGPDSRDPISLDESGSRFLESLDRDFQGTRIAWSQNLGNYPVEPIVNQVCNASKSVFQDLGCDISDAEPDFSGADDIFQTLRAWGFAESRRDDLLAHRSLIKDTVIWNTELGLNLTARDIASAQTARTALYRRIMAFLDEYEFLMLPVSQVPPFPVEVEWVRDINGSEMQTYIDWMATCYAITCTGLPAISIPCGFTPDGLPIGLQIVGRHHCDFEVLQIAHAFEKATQYSNSRPAVINTA
ncbi:MAG: amidase [Rhodospirillaceae bacterium]|nr:amidase [Rhodospirillaceae bacterium]